VIELLDILTIHTNGIPQNERTSNMSNRKFWCTEIQVEYTFSKPTTFSEIAGVPHETISRKIKRNNNGKHHALQKSEDITKPN